VVKFVSNCDTDPAAERRSSSYSSHDGGLGVLMFDLQGAGDAVVAALADGVTAPAVSGLRWTIASRVELASANMFSSMSIVRIMLNLRQGQS